jgi:steroid 5-alpha reductase family enzyme
VALSAALLMLVILLKVTGVPTSAAASPRSRGDKYRAYQRTTSTFVPWFPRPA